MAAVPRLNTQPIFADKQEIERIIEEMYALMGIPDDPTATAEKSRAMILADRVKPEENAFSRGIIAAREGQPYNDLSTKRAAIHPANGTLFQR